MEIVEITENKSSIAAPILRALPEWFGIEESTQSYIDGVVDKPLIVALADSQPIGFLSLKEHFPETYEIYVMGVYPQYHGQGAGKLLMEYAEEFLRGRKVRFLQVKTLSENSPDKNYAKTRSFYSKCGFIPVEEFKTLWDEWNPCLLMIKSLNL